MSYTVKGFTLLFLAIFFSATATYAQPNEDSLLYIANNTLDDSIRFNQFHDLASGFKFYDLEKTKQYTDSIAQLYLRTNNLKHKGVADYYYGFYFRKKDQYDKAISYFDLATQYALDEKNHIIFCASMAEIAGIYFYQGELAKALEININAADFNRKANDQYANSRLSDNYNNIGLIYGELEEYDNALRNYRKAISVSTTPLEESVAAGNMAEIFIVLNEVDSISLYANRCYELEQKLNSPRGIAYAAWLKAKAFLMAGDLKNAEKSAEKSLELYKKWDEKIMSIDPNYILSKAQFEQGKHVPAIKNAKIGIALSQEISNLEYISNGQLILSEIYASTGQYKEALQYNKLYQMNVDSLDFISNRDKLNNLSVKYETAQKNEKIASQKLEISRKDTQRYGLLASLFILSLILILFLYRYKSNQKIANQKIAFLNQEKKLLSIDYMFQGQEEERKRIAQDLHDGLGGILSAAKIQIRTIQNEIEKLESLNLISKTEDLIESAYNEVRRISHDMMPGALVNLGLFAAIEDLADQMNLANQVKIKTQWYTSDELLPEKATPIIYRIVQEAITNTMKYAKAENMLIQMTESADGFSLAIEDDGIGFVFDDIKSEGLGIKSIQSRVDYLNGKMEIDTKVNGGTKYEIFIPV